MDETNSITPDYETIEFRNPFYSKADGLAIDLELKDPRFGWQPFTATASDVEPQGAILFNRALAAGNVGPYVAPPPAPYQIAKTTPWLRMTDDEADTMDGVMSQTSSRVKQIYMAATYLSSDDPLWQTLWQILSDAFGAARANELLAPET